MFQAHLVYSLPQLQNQSFLQGHLVPLTGEWYWKHDLGVGHDPCYWDIITSRPAQQTELENISMYANPWIHTHVYLVLYLSISI